MNCDGYIKRSSVFNIINFNTALNKKIIQEIKQKRETNRNKEKERKKGRINTEEQQKEHKSVGELVNDSDCLVYFVANVEMLHTITQQLILLLYLK
jgi:hypothetical protein